jgi:hypothetical protein
MQRYSLRKIKLHCLYVQYAFGGYHALSDPAILPMRTCTPITNVFTASELCVAQCSLSLVLRCMQLLLLLLAAAVVDCK